MYCTVSDLDYNAASSLIWGPKERDMILLVSERTRSDGPDGDCFDRK